ncbi:hypothetical protein H4R19_002545 [Coemansia spiralis]|nr:hypothetical protein H4R19_002545 [Coemansia spiralis]
MDYMWSFAGIVAGRNGEGPHRPPPPPTGLHGVLGKWAVVGFGINICSIVCSASVILATCYVCLTNVKLMRRPSLRIATAIAVCDLMYSACQVMVFNNKYMSSLAESRLRAILWVMAGSTVSFVLLSTCMGIQLALAVVTRRGRLALMVQPWYEVASFTAGFLITHPYLYLFRSVRWIPTAQVFYLEDNVAVARRNLWLIQWMWVFASIVFLFCIAVATYMRMSGSWKETAERSSPGMPEKLDLLDSGTMQMITPERGRYIRSVTLRVTMYPMIPVVTQTMVVVGNLLSRAPFWLFVLANIMPTIQGVLNFIAYVMSPALDEYRKPLVKRLLGIKGKTGPEFGPLASTDDSQPPSPASTLPRNTYSAYKAGGSSTL